jgi:hypothetical protein
MIYNLEAILELSRKSAEGRWQENKSPALILNIAKPHVNPPLTPLTRPHAATM